MKAEKAKPEYNASVQNKSLSGWPGKRIKWPAGLKLEVVSLQEQLPVT